MFSNDAVSFILFEKHIKKKKITFLELEFLRVSLMNI